MRYPTNNTYVSSSYGWRYYDGQPNFHKGCDFPRPFMGPVYAILNGRVLTNEWRFFGGWTVSILWDDGVTSWYQHLFDKSDLVPGNRVAEGAVVGQMGMTGDMVTGVHLHFECYRNGESFDPIPYLRAGVAAGGGSEPLPIPDYVPEEEDDDMAKNSGFFYTRAKDKQRVNLIVNLGTPIWFEYLGGATKPANSNNGVASTLDTGSYAEVTEAFAIALKARIDAGNK